MINRNVYELQHRAKAEVWTRLFCASLYSLSISCFEYEKDVLTNCPLGVHSLKSLFSLLLNTQHCRDPPSRSQNFAGKFFKRKVPKLVWMGCFMFNQPAAKTSHQFRITRKQELDGVRGKWILWNCTQLKKFLFEKYGMMMTSWTSAVTKEQHFWQTLSFHTIRLFLLHIHLVMNVEPFGRQSQDVNWIKKTGVREK